jgi:hypothetical protein
MFWHGRVASVLAFFLLVVIVSAACRGTFSRKYEYEEDVYLNVDGSATVYVNASVPALVALRGVDLDPDPRARFDRRKLRAIFESPYSEVESVTGSRRDNRRYVHLRLNVPDITKLGNVAPFAWSKYVLTPDGDVLKYEQTLGASAARDVGNAGWSGSELVAVRLHLPSRVPFHNAPSKIIERGNIIRWEQPLAERIKSQPLEIEVHLETQSILARTLVLFGSMMVLAALTFALVIWLVMRRKGLKDFRDARGI